MSCEFCKDGNCCQKEATSSGADAFGIEDPSQLVDPASTASVAKEKEPIDASKTSACFDDAKGACCRMSDHVLDLFTHFTNWQSNRKRLDNIFTRDLIIGLSDGLTVPVRMPSKFAVDELVCTNSWSIIPRVTSFRRCRRARGVVQRCNFDGRWWILVDESRT
jgi:hypothetical protein